MKKMGQIVVLEGWKEEKIFYTNTWITTMV